MRTATAFRGGLRAWVLGFLPLQLLSACTSPAQLEGRVRPGMIRASWVTTCRTGEDGFASNCVASISVSPVVLRLSTADSQLSVSILHPDCEEVRYFDRVDVIGLSRSRRAELVAQAFASAAITLHERCPHLPRPLPNYDHAPDISVIGDVR